MSQSVTLTWLRQQIAYNLGEGDVTGTFTQTPGNQAYDSNRFDADGAWDGGWIQDTTTSPYPIARINNWALANNAFVLYAPFSSPMNNGDSYELHKLLSFGEMRTAINRGLSMCGSALRTYVRDETNTLVSGTYQVTPNYNVASANAFFPGGVEQIDIQVNPGLPTATWIPMNDWNYLDDETIQLPEALVDGYAGMLIRLSGYGPVAGMITSDAPATVIGTFDDDFAPTMLIWASTHQAWLILAAKQTVGEANSTQQNAQFALQQFEAAAAMWKRPRPRVRMMKDPYQGGWTG